jgi:hypothetical protein
MIADPWIPTSFLAYKAGVLQQLWTRKCVSYDRQHSWQPKAMRREWTEQEWRDVKERDASPTPETVEPSR